MDYKTWKEKIVSLLVYEGFENEDAVSKANSLKGYFYDEDNHPSPYQMVDKILHSDRITPLERHLIEINKRKLAKKGNGRRSRVFN